MNYYRTVRVHCGGEASVQCVILTMCHPYNVSSLQCVIPYNVSSLQCVIPTMCHPYNVSSLQCVIPTMCHPYNVSSLHPNECCLCAGENPTPRLELWQDQTNGQTDTLTTGWTRTSRTCHVDPPPLTPPPPPLFSPHPRSSRLL